MPSNPGALLVAIVDNNNATQATGPAGWPVVVNVNGLTVLAHRAATGDPATVTVTAGAGTPSWSGVVLAYQSAAPAVGAAHVGSQVAPVQAAAATVWGVETILEAWASGGGVGTFTISVNVNNPTTRASIPLNGTAPALFVVEFQTNIAASSMTGDTAANAGATCDSVTVPLVA